MLKLYSNEMFNINDKAFVISHDTVYESTVVGTSADMRLLTVQLAAPVYGTMSVYSKNAFHDELTARSALYARNHQRFLKYKAEIKTLTDLLTFPLTHLIAGEDMDEQARQAYTVRAEELGYPLFDENSEDWALLQHATAPYQGKRLDTSSNI